MTYTPTTEEVRAIYRHGRDEIPLHQGVGFPHEEFDRWLAEELRQAKEQAWDEGAEAVALLIPEYEWHDRGLRLPTNPYRSQP